MPLRVQILRPTLVHPKLDRTVSHYRRFNNSILHFRDNLYLMTYRLFLPPPPPSSVAKDDDDIVYHPWRSNWKSYVDQTILVLLEYHATTRTFAIRQEQPLHYLCPKDQAVDDSIADARLMWFKDHVYVHGNGWGISSHEFGAQQKQLKTTIVQCSQSRTCELAVEVLLKLDANRRRTSDPSDVHEMIFPCMNNEFSYDKRGTDIVEKNWSFFEVNQQMYTEYTLGPHIVAHIDMDTPRSTCNHPVNCEQIHYHPSSVFQQLAAALGGGCYFSPGGSPLRWSRHEFINVGHVKYRYTEVDLLPLAERRDRLRMHPVEYVYLMFFYTFSARKPFELRRVSHAFIPDHAGNPYALVFAMGVALLPQRHGVVVSYGEGDSTPNLLMLSRRDVERMLHPVDAITPQTYTFTWLPAERVG